MFDSVAPRYDALNRIMSFGMDRGWRRYAVSQALRGSPVTVLDAGAGTCDLGLEIERASHGNVQVISVDFAREMLKHGVARIRKTGADARAVQGNVLELPIASSSVDAVISAFTLRNLDSLSTAWSSLARVLRPGGRLVVLEMTPVNTPVFRQLFRIYFHRWVPWMGRRVSGHSQAYAWLPRSVDQFPSAEHLAGQIESAGFSNVAFRRLGLGTVAIHVADRR